MYCLNFHRVRGGSSALNHDFNEHIFLQEEEEYSSESIDFASVDFQNNED